MYKNNQKGNVTLVVLLCLLILLVAGAGFYVVFAKLKETKDIPTSQIVSTTNKRTIDEWGVSGDVSRLPADLVIKVSGDTAYFSSTELDVKLEAISCELFCMPAKYFYTIEREKGGVTLPNGQQADKELLSSYIKIGDYYYYPGTSYPGSWPSEPSQGQVKAGDLISQYGDAAETFLLSLN